MWRVGHRERGDTLIEVLMAVVALSVVVTVCYTVMTRGFAQGQTALERTTTQGMISGQTAILRDVFARHEKAKSTGTDTAEWTTISSNYILTVNGNNLDSKLAPARTACSLGVSTSPGGKNEFYFDVNNETLPNTSLTMPQVFLTAKKIRSANYPVYGDGMWIEGYLVDTPGSDSKPYYIFFIKACWDAGISSERQKMVTNVRFYEAY